MNTVTEGFFFKKKIIKNLSVPAAQITVVGYACTACFLEALNYLLKLISQYCFFLFSGV